MKRFTKGAIMASFLSILFVIGFSTTANAQTGNRCHRAGVNQRQERQQDRIGRGITSGSLTPAEAARLESQEARINAQEARFRASGDGLSPRERAKLESELNTESRNIYRQEHDRQHQQP